MMDQHLDKATPRPQVCEWCIKPYVTRAFLSDDAGSTIEAENMVSANDVGRGYTLSHAWDDAWWPCRATGSEIRIVVSSRDSYDQLRTQLAAYRELLQEVLNSGVEFDDERLGYTVMQVDKGTLDDIRAALEEG